jgi:hypothetical protein
MDLAVTRLMGVCDVTLYQTVITLCDAVQCRRMRVSVKQLQWYVPL